MSEEGNERCEAVRLTDGLPLAIHREGPELWECCRGCQLADCAGLMNCRHWMRACIHDSGPPHFLQTVTVHSAPTHARLWKLVVCNASLLTPRGHGPVATKRDFVADFFMGEKMSERHQGM